MRTRRTLVRKDEQRSTARRARCHRVHSATVNRPTGVPRSPTHCLRQRGHCRTLARSTAGCRAGHYNYFRSYSAERGRYTQADPIGLDGGFNRFGYVEGNPLVLKDSDGLFVQGLGALCFTSPVSLLVCGGAAAGAGLTMSSPSGRRIIKNIAQKIEDICQADEKDPCELAYEEERSDCWNNYGGVWGKSHFSYIGFLGNAKNRWEQCMKGQPQITKWGDGNVSGEPRICSRGK